MYLESKYLQTNKQTRKLNTNQIKSHTPQHSIFMAYEARLYKSTQTKRNPIYV
jgi:hypothetical protein